MKKILIPCLVLFLGTGTNAQTKQDVLNQMSQVGDQHNQSLDAMYNALQANSANLNTNAPNKDKTDILTGIENSTIPVPLQKAGADIQKNAVQVINNNLLQSLANGSSQDISSVIIANSTLNSDERLSLTKLLSIIDQDNNNLSALAKDLDAFNELIFQQYGINSNSTYALIAASSVARSSANYWALNSAKWINAGNSSKSNPTGKLQQACCGGIIHSDATGAGAGAIGGALVGAAAGGIGAVPGAVAGAIGGGIASSAGAAIVSLYHWLWP